MIRKLGGVLQMQYSPIKKERGQALILVPLELSKGGSRWFNTSKTGGVNYGN